LPSFNIFSIFTLQRYKTIFEKQKQKAATHSEKCAAAFHMAQFTELGGGLRFKGSKVQEFKGSKTLFPPYSKKTKQP
jgi:hypothetical protein